ncbi:MAG: protein kinase [Lentisphaeraceae bacterium]|nr:protein kinase [Lentisphaeraceae bacterium]
MSNDDIEKSFSETISGFAELYSDSDEELLSSTHLELSEQPQGKYTILHELAQGGMKKIFTIEDADTTRTLAMAVIKGDTSSESDIQRFIYEARITALLEHPNIVPVHDMGLSPKGDPYFTMKLISGESLLSIIDKLKNKHTSTCKNFPLTELLNIFLKICDAIAYAHSKDVIHLDLKPDNIQVSSYGEVLVVDWGLAKIINSPLEDELLEFDKVSGSVDLTQNGLIKGTPGYFAPEQASGRNQEKNKLTDIYALGALLYSILTLEKPIQGDNLEDICKATLRGDITPPHIRSPKYNIPLPLEAICLKAMSISSQNRYQSVDAINHEIQAWQSGFSTRAEDAGFLQELRLLFFRHKAVSALILTVLFICGYFFIRLKNNEQTILKTVNKLEIEKNNRQKISRLAAPKILEEALTYISELKFSKALQAASLCTELNRALSDGWLLKGQLLYGDQDFENAKKSFLQSKHPLSNKYLQLMESYRTPFNKLPETEVLLLIKELHKISNKDFITIQIFNAINLSKRPITQKLKLTGKALAALNPHDEKFHFECYFHENGDIQLLLNGSWTVSNIKPLISLPVTHLNLQDTSIEDIRILKTMPIKSLNLSFSPIKDISPLAKMDIEVLDIRGSQITNLKTLSTLQPLKKIQINQNSLTIIEALLALDKTKNISINNTDISILRHRHKAKLRQHRQH